MKRVLLVLAMVLAISTQAYAFLESPTTINHPPTARETVLVSPDFVDVLMASPKLSDGIELVSLTGDGKRLHSMMGELSESLNGNMLDAAQAYILENAKVFNLPSNESGSLMKPIRMEEAAGAHHVAFQMNIDGINVYEAVIQIHISQSDGVIRLAHGSYPTIERITNQIRLSRLESIRAASEHLQATRLRGIPKSELMIYPTDEAAGRMVYVVQIPSGEPLGDYKIIVDADTGEEIYRNNEMVFRTVQTGRGKVLMHHPNAGPAAIERLVNLTGKTLEGLYVRVTNNGGAASNSDTYEHIHDWRTSINFDEVNAYFHVSKIHALFRGMGFTRLDRPLKTVVRYGTNYDNAFYSPWQRMIAFGSGSRLNNLAHEESVIYHEYAHAVLDQIVRLTYSGESGAMNEGQADYFACTISNDHLVGEYAVAKMGRPFLRDLSNKLVYPDDIQNQVHADGRIWGGALWDIRQALGARTADLLIHKSFFYLSAGRPRFIDGYKALATADRNLNNGRNKEVLFRIMKARGITATAYLGAVIDRGQIAELKKFKQAHSE